ncbi:MAG: hypothetical protein CM1200mP29_06050 [Verrucomicrobiota bacterium]|nr:MAG: hypothetical protein CM1200mP29_06050 [Verrucomicrobiota bacterium]
MTPSGVPDAPHTPSSPAAPVSSGRTFRAAAWPGRTGVVIDDSPPAHGTIASVPDDPNLTVMRAPSPVGLARRRRSGSFPLCSRVGGDLVVQSPIRTIETNLKATRHPRGPGPTAPMLSSSSEGYGKSSRKGFRNRRPAHRPPRWAPGATPAQVDGQFLALAFQPSANSGHRGPYFQHRRPQANRAIRMVLPRFIEAAKAGEPLRVFGDGQQSRCFGHVADTVEALCAWPSAPARRAAIQYGSTDEVTILALAKRVIELTDGLQNRAVRTTRRTIRF